MMVISEYVTIPRLFYEGLPVIASYETEEFKNCLKVVILMIASYALIDDVD